MADLLIRGKTLPPNDEDLRVIIYSNGQVIIDRGVYCDETEAVELPDHGPLCDLDAFMEEINLTCLALGNAGVEITGDMLWAKLWDAYENAETIIPASKEGGE